MNRPQKRSAEKLTDQQVEKIRKLRADGVELEDLANRFGVGKTYISQVCCGHHRSAA